MIGVWIAALFIAIALIAGCASVLRKDERRADLSYNMDPKPKAVYHCTLCDGLWDHGEPESHLAGCLAAQIEKDIGPKASVGVTLKI